MPKQFNGCNIVHTTCEKKGSYSMLNYKKISFHKLMYGETPAVKGANFLYVKEDLRKKQEGIDKFSI